MKSIVAGLALLALGSSAALAGRPFEPHSPLFKGAITTGSWGGYVINSAPPYRSASATWQVPDVTYDGGPTPYGYEYVLNWTGVGGFGDSTLIQLGTESVVSTAGTKLFYSWYELYPAVSVAVPLTVKAGDVMTASLACTANCLPGMVQTWEMKLVNGTSGLQWSKSVQYQSSMASAEWVVEPPFYGNSFLPLANYGKTTYTPVLANGQNPGLSYDANGIIMIGNYGQTSNPSQPVNGNAFSVCWGSGGALTPCTAGSITPPPPRVTASLSASPSSISAGQPSTLSWSSMNATSCSGSGFVADGVSGSKVVWPLATTTYSVTCSGQSGTATAAAKVTVKKNRPERK